MQYCKYSNVNRPITVTIERAQQLTGLGRTSIYNFLREGKLHKTKLGARTLIGYDELEHLVAPHKKQVNDLSNEENA